jgi:hypothetical protein
MPAAILAVAKAVRSLALGSSGAALVIAAVLYDDGLSGADVLGLLLAIAPPVMLWILWAALRELAELPERVRRLPETARGHGDDVRRLAQELRTPGQRLLRVPVTLWRLRKVSELIRPHAAVLPFLSVPFLTLSAFAALAAIGEVGIAVLLIAAAL